MTVINADALHLPIASKTVQCVVTSPPYYGLRDYCVDGQIGLEQSPDEYVANLVAAFREVWRVMKDDGTLWVNLGDSYAAGGRGGNSDVITGKAKNASKISHWTPNKSKRIDQGHGRWGGGNLPATNGLKPKDLIGIPWRVAFALQADGWYLRSDIIWSKPNPMPESVTDRPTKAHEYLFLLAKSQKYFYDADAIREDGKWSTEERKARVKPEHKSIPDEKKNGIRQCKPAGWDTRQGAHGSFHRSGRAEDIEYTLSHSITRNKRSVWEIATQPTSYAHFATYPEKLVEPCILAGSRPGDLVLDPFSGSGTTGRVAIRHNRRYIGTELNFSYIADITPIRLTVQPVLCEAADA